MRSPVSSPTPSYTPSTSFHLCLISEWRKRWRVRLKRLHIKPASRDQRFMKKQISVVSNWLCTNLNWRCTKSDLIIISTQRPQRYTEGRRENESECDFLCKAI